MFYFVGMSYAGLYISFAFWFLFLFAALSWFDSGSMSCFLFCFSFFRCGYATSLVHLISWTFCSSLSWPIPSPSWLFITTICLLSGVLQSRPICSPTCLLFLYPFMSRGVLAIMILCCYCLLFFYFWYSSYRNGFKMSCCFYASMDFWKSIHKPKSISSESSNS